MNHYNITIHGNVQGVFYRVSAQEKARELGLTGFVRNEPDGTVFIEAEGSKESLEQFLNWCEEGSNAAEVTRVDKLTGDVKNYEEFIIEDHD